MINVLSPSGRSREKSIRLLQRRFRVDIGENVLMDRVVKHCIRLLRELVDSPSLEMLKNSVDVALGDTVQCGLDLRGLFQLNQFVILQPPPRVKHIQELFKTSKSQTSENARI